MNRPTFIWSDHAMQRAKQRGVDQGALPRSREATKATLKKLKTRGVRLGNLNVNKFYVAGRNVFITRSVREGTLLIVTVIKLGARRSTKQDIGKSRWHKQKSADGFNING